MTSPTAERPLGELFSDLASETASLVRQEMTLVRAEMADKATAAAKEAAVVSAGGAMVHAGVLGLLASAIAGLAMWMPVWIAALAVGLVFALAGWAVMSKGMTALKAIDPAPTKTLRTLQDNHMWAKKELSR